MIEKQSISDQQLIDCLITNYGIKVANFTFLPIGADANASVYKAQTLDQSCYFVKLKRGHHHDISVDIVGLLQDVGIKQIIPPINTTHGRPTQRIDDFTLIVYPYIDGQDGFNRDLTDDQWILLGKTLRQVHEIDVPSSIQHRLRREEYSPKWRKAIRSLYKHIETEPSGDEMAMKLISFMKDNAEDIHTIVDRAEQLGHKLQDQSPEFVLCHSDIHGGNVLMDGNNTLYIVDWDEPMMAPKERDLMYIGGGVANVWNKPHEEELFYKGYGKTEINREILAYYRYERIVEDIALYGHDLLLTTGGGEDRKVAYNMVTDMFVPDGVVDIAFKTDARLSESR